MLNLTYTIFTNAFNLNLESLKFLKKPTIKAIYNKLKTSLIFVVIKKKQEFVYDVKPCLVFVQ